MFTGIIESLGTIERLTSTGQGNRLDVRTDLDLGSTRIGDSIAVNGACLTAVSLSRHRFSVDMAPETVSRTTFSRSAPGACVNIERAMQLSSRIDGHLVSGHIDGTGVVTAIQTDSNAILLDISVPPHLAEQMIEKGSVAVDGISLTITRCTGSGFRVSVIPHTARLTTIGRLNTGDRVNIETDMIGKYVRKFLTRGTDDAGAGPGKASVSMSFLAENGFL